MKILSLNYVLLFKCFNLIGHTSEYEEYRGIFVMRNRVFGGHFEKSIFFKNRAFLRCYTSKIDFRGENL